MTATTPLSPAVDPARLFDADTLAKARAAKADPAYWSRTRGAAEAFEAQFLSQMLSQMFSGREADPLTGGGSAEEMFRSLLVEQYGKEMVKAGGIGIADAVQKQMLKMQEV